MSNITFFDGHWECKVCSNTPDADGVLAHGKGCYTMDEDGGGTEYVGDEVKEKEQRRLQALVQELEADLVKANHIIAGLLPMAPITDADLRWAQEKCGELERRSPCT